MLFNLLNKMRGYVVVEVRGFSVERFINLAARRGVLIWDLNYDGPFVTMKVSIKGFRELRFCARKTGCKFRIVQKVGYPFFAHKYRKRTFFLGGVAVFVMFLYIMSAFVWLVEVEGAKRVDTLALLEFAKDRGLYPGAKKSTIDRRALEQEIAFNFPDIGFVNIGLDGTRAAIAIAETIPKLTVADTSRPCDIIASKDGIISDIYVISGTPKVRVRDVVSKGDVLVSGELMAGGEFERMSVGLTHAQANVRAKLYYNMNFAVDRYYTERVYTGAEKTAYSLNILNKELKLINYSTLYESYDKIIERKQIAFGEDYPLPVFVIKEIYREYEPVMRIRSIDEMKALAGTMVTNRILREFDFNADVTDKVIEYSEDLTGLNVYATIITDEDIGEIRYYN